MPQKPSYQELEARVRELETESRSQSDCQLTSFVENAVVGFYRSTPQGIFQWVNTAFARILGYDTAEALLEDSGDLQKRFFANQQDRERFVRLIRKNGEVDNIEFEVVQKNGKTIWVSETSRARYDQDGELVAFEGVVINISRRKKSEMAQKEAETFTRSLLNSLPVPVFYKDRDGIYRGFNRAFEVFFGNKSQNLVGKGVFEINPPDLARIYKAKDDALFESGGTQRYETQVSDAKNTLKDVIFDKSVYRDSKGDISGIIGTVLDITQRRRMEQALRKSEERFRELAELLPGAVVETDLGVNISYVNRMGLTMFGYSREDVEAGLNGLDIFCKSQRDAAAFNLRRRIAGEIMGPKEYRMIAKSGEEFWVVLNASRIYRNDTVEGLRVVLTDISDLKAIEKERENLIEELQEALSEIKTLKGIVPICSKCKKIRDDQGYWNILETFIQEHSEASFSHSLCPECSETLYGEHDWYQKMKAKKNPSSQE